MSKKPKTVFTFDVNGAKKKILSLIERSDGEVRILVPHAENYEAEDGSKIGIKNQYYSLHLSPKSEAGSCTFKQTIALVNGDVRSSVHYSNVLKNGTHTVLFSSRPADISIERYNANLSIRDRDVPLGQFNPKTGNILFSVLVSPRGTDFSPHHGSLNTTYVDSFYLRITIVWTFLYLPSHSSGDRIHNTTSFIGYNNRPTPRLPFALGAVEGHHNDKAETLICAAFEGLKTALISRVHHELPQIDPHAMMMMARDFHRHPYL